MKLQHATMDHVSYTLLNIIFPCLLLYFFASTSYFTRSAICILTSSTVALITVSLADCKRAVTDAMYDVEPLISWGFFFQERAIEMGVVVAELVLEGRRDVVVEVRAYLCGDRRIVRCGV